jgi:hypothetical protein
MKPLIKTLSVRVRDKHASVLNRMAFDVNQVWNTANADCAKLSWVAVPEVGYVRNSQKPRWLNPFWMQVGSC